MSDRLTRKEIKRDEFAEALESSVGWLEKNAKLLIAVAVVVLLATLAGVGVRAWLASQAEAANEALAEALEVYRAPVGDDVAAVAGEEEPDLSFPSAEARRSRAAELFTAVRDQYGGSEPADVAGVFLAQIAVEEGDTARARELWQDFLEAHGDHLLSGQVRVNLIHLDRQEGNAEQVVAELEEELNAAPDDRTLPADLVLWELGQTYEQMGRDDEARSTFRRLAEEYPTSPYASEAQRKAPPEGGAAGPTGLGGNLVPGA